MVSQLIVLFLSLIFEYLRAGLELRFCLVSERAIIILISAMGQSLIYNSYCFLAKIYLILMLRPIMRHCVMKTERNAFYFLFFRFSILFSSFNFVFFIFFHYTNILAIFFFYSLLFMHFKKNDSWKIFLKPICIKCLSILHSIDLNR